MDLRACARRWNRSRSGIDGDRLSGTNSGARAASGDQPVIEDQKSISSSKTSGSQSTRDLIDQRRLTGAGESDGCLAPTFSVMRDDAEGHVARCCEYHVSVVLGDDHRAEPDAVLGAGANVGDVQIDVRPRCS